MIVTNHHVVSGKKQRNNRLGNESIPSHLVAQDRNVDPAIPTCDASRRPTGGIAIRPSSTVAPGEPVRTLGFPLPDLLSDGTEYIDGALSP